MSAQGESVTSTASPSKGYRRQKGYGTLKRELKQLNREFSADDSIDSDLDEEALDDLDALRRKVEILQTDFLACQQKYLETKKALKQLQAETQNGKSLKSDSEGRGNNSIGNKFLRFVLLLCLIAIASFGASLLHPKAIAHVWGAGVAEKGHHAVRGMLIGFCASLLAGWSSLCLWAIADSPSSRRSVAILSAAVISGFVATEYLAVQAKILPLDTAVPVVAVQGTTIVLLFAAFLSSLSASSSRGEARLKSE